MGKKFAADKRLLGANYMPPLKRKKDNEEYDYKNDEVLKWISQQPEMIDYLFGILTRRGCIKFNPETGMWQGVKRGNLW